MDKEVFITDTGTIRWELDERRLVVRVISNYTQMDIPLEEIREFLSQVGG